MHPSFFFAAPMAVQVHAAIALILIPLTITIFLIPRGTTWHKRLGWIWVIGMALAAMSSFLISELKMVGPFSPIHLLSAFTLAALVYAIVNIRRRNVVRHRRAMLGLVYGALIGAGAFTMLPGRIMHQVFFGG